MQFHDLDTLSGRSIPTTKKSRHKYLYPRPPFKMYFIHICFMHIMITRIVNK